MSRKVPLNYVCEGFKSFFTHIDRPTKLMAGLILRGVPPPTS